ncbi:4-(cytidine 5'-diphospho)-2-C-methyl-D-erythritol kinase [Alphaproteobacteria bacterium LSUCC0744]
MISVLAPAKINLFLRVCGKDDRGYHHLDSLIVFTEFGDQLTLELASDDALSVKGEFSSVLGDAALAGPGFNRQTPDNIGADNLVMRALDGYRQVGGVIGGLSITLEKNIPVGAGLGGGSADAAALLRAVNALSSAPLEAATLFKLAASLGADVPVCLAGGCQRIAGIGDVMTPFTMPQTGAILLANPRIQLSTRDVFTHSGIRYSGVAGSLDGLDAAGLVALGNDLTPAALVLVPQIRSCLEIMEAASGVKCAAMSGSGASCFALFEQASDAKAAAAQLETAGYWAIASQIYQVD